MALGVEKHVLVTLEVGVGRMLDGRKTAFRKNSHARKLLSNSVYLFCFLCFARRLPCGWIFLKEVTINHIQ